MAVNLQVVSQLLGASLDPRQNKQGKTNRRTGWLQSVCFGKLKLHKLSIHGPELMYSIAEIAIHQEEKKPGFSLSLLQIVASDSYPNTTRLASSLLFKNFIKRNWTDEEGNYKLPQNEVVAIKQELIGLMISVPPAIQSQLGEAISVVADSDFWERWDTLVDDLVSRLSPDDAVVNNGVLQVAHSIFKRWRPLFRSDDLFTEINHVLSRFGAPFLSLLENTDHMIEQNQGDKLALQQSFSTLNLILKLFYDLSSQDLPPIFEENLSAITSLLHKYLTYDNPILHTDDDAESGPQEFVKAGICEVLVLYVQKYEDAFGPLLGQFVSSSWNLLTTVGPEPKYDILISKALQFLTAVARIQQHAQGFNNESTLGQVVEKVILPNLSLRETDIELFEDEPIEFIRRDLEGSDSDTRRRAATDFLRQLMEQFEKLVTEVVFRYIDHYLTEYSKDPSNQWKAKDTAVYLFSSIAAKGVTTTSQGLKSVNTYVDVVDFFQKNIASELISDTGVEPILKVDAIKYLYNFRSQMTKEQWQDAFPLLVKHLGSSNYVVYTYAAIAVERILYLTNDAREPIIGKADVLPLSKDLLEHLFKLIEAESAPEKIQENEFLMRCVMRVLIVVREGVVSITDSVLAHFIKITRIISQNPSNPRFYYYHFEALGAFAAPSQPEKLENALYAPFAGVLANDVQEFMPYVFQLFAALLEANPAASLSEYYQGLIPPIIQPTLWESKGNVPALVRLLSSIIPRGASEIAKNNQIEPILGIFQNLISKKTSESYGFDLLESVIASFSPTALQSYFVPMLTIMLTRLQNSRTENFSLRFVRFYHFISAREDEGLGADFFISITEQVQANIFTNLYLNVYLPETQKLARPLDRKTAVVSLTKTLADSHAFAERYALKGWGLTCNALLKLLENPPLPVTTDDAIPDQDVDDLGFGVGFTQLNTCRKVAKDPWPEIVDAKKWVGQYLKAADGRYNGRVNRFVQERLSPEARQVLVSYMRG
ncbi:MAG: importin-alpha export receptor [Pycnora praestabilis]|nr:MAG: importin-alpha export receptor [Pycnora praestabilis]